MPLQVINGIGRVGIRVASPAVPAFDADAQAFITAAALTDTTQKNAINDLVLDLKAAGVWTKMKAVYPMVGGTATTHKFNLKDPRDLDAAYRLVFNGGWTHSTTGALPNGSNAYANTFLQPLVQNNTHLSFYSRTNAVSTGADMGNFLSAPTGAGTYIDIRGASNLFSFRVNSIGVESSFSNASSLGLAVINRVSSTQQSAFFNNVKNTFTVTSTGVPTGNIIIGAMQYGASILYGNHQCAFASIGDGLTDLESNLFYQIVEKYQYALGRNINATQSFYFNRNYSNETNAFIFNGGITDATQQSAVNTLVTTLKTAGVWTKMKAVYPMVGGTANSHKFNLVNPVDTDAAYRLSFVGGGTHSSNGYLPNGTNAYANTFLVPRTVLTSMNNHISYYSRTNAGFAYDNGVSDDFNITGQSLIATYNHSANISKTFIQCLDANAASGVETNSLGLIMGSRTSSTSLKLYRNGTLKGTNTTSTSIPLPNMNTYIGGINYRNASGVFSIYYGNKQCAFASIGDGLTDAEALAYYNAVQAFQTTLNRQV